MTYQISIGWNNAAGLQDVAPQPRCHGIRLGRFTIGGDGHTYQDGFMSTEWEFTALTDESQFEDLVVQFGLVAQRSRAVTIRTARNHDRDFSNYNAIIQYPDVPEDGKYDDGFWKNVTFKIRRMTALDEEGSY